MAENPVKYFFAGGVGGVLTVLVGHPFDTVKVRLQTMSLDKPQYKGKSWVQIFFARVSFCQMTHDNFV